MYTAYMSATEAVKRVTVSAAVVPELVAELDVIAGQESRSRSQVCEMLLVRGLAAFRRDGSLEETDDDLVNAALRGTEALTAAEKALITAQKALAKNSLLLAELRAEIEQRNERLDMIEADIERIRSTSPTHDKQHQ